MAAVALVNSPSPDTAVVGEVSSASLEQETVVTATANVMIRILYIFFIFVFLR
jgi:hypothetical protein